MGQSSFPGQDLPFFAASRPGIDASDEAAYLAAFLEQENGNTRPALELAERSRRLRPGCSELRNLLGNLYLALNRPEEALQEYRVARELAPDIPAFRANYESLARRMARDGSQR